MSSGQFQVDPLISRDARYILKCNRKPFRVFFKFLICKISLTHDVHYYTENLYQLRGAWRKFWNTASFCCCCWHFHIYLIINQLYTSLHSKWFILGIKCSLLQLHIITVVPRSPRTRNSLCYMLNKHRKKWWPLLKGIYSLGIRQETTGRYGQMDGVSTRKRGNEHLTHCDLTPVLQTHRCLMLPQSHSVGIPWPERVQEWALGNQHK